jgi:hypothetical protein
MRYLILFLFTFGFLHCGANASFEQSSVEPPSHKEWTLLLQKYVTEEGYVDYAGFKSDESELDSYLETLQKHPPNASVWSKEEQISYWINVYNAFTVKLILDHYPVASIKDIAGGIPFVNTPWDIKFIEIGGETYDLNNVEHGILRKQFNEPLIHVAVNCASVSCPRLRNEAFEAERLTDQLKDQASYFINRSGKNQISENALQLSKILKWYGGDFDDRYGSAEGFVRAFAKQAIADEVEIDFLEYNWDLNTQENFRKAGL